MDSLFVCGTLLPGCENAHLLQSIGGSWGQGSVSGSLLDAGWGPVWGIRGLFSITPETALRDICFTQRTGSSIGMRLMNLKGRRMPE